MEFRQLELPFVSNIEANSEEIKEAPAIDNEFLLQDRIQKIQQIVGEYGEENFYISFSGGKDSTVLSELVDMALPGNKIPRVFANTGIELSLIKKFVMDKAKDDDRFVIIKPSVPIKQMLEKYGYPFKSKAHSKWLDQYQRNGRVQSIENYLGSEKKDKDLFRTCPKILSYQFSPNFKLKVSDKCCLYMKEKPLDEWSKKNNRPYGMNGVMRAEGGAKEHC